MHASFVIHVFKGPQHGREIDGALSKHQVVVNVGDHVLNMNIHNTVPPAPDVIRNCPGLVAVHMPNIKRELKKLMVQTVI